MSDQQPLIDAIKKIRDTPGYVYLIRNKDIYKIGITMSIEKRLRQIKPDEVLETMRMANTRGVEKILHQRFRDKRIPQTEYFRLTEEEIVEARYLFRALRGDQSVNDNLVGWSEEAQSIRNASKQLGKLDFSSSAAAWVDKIEQFGRSCDYEKMLWTEVTTSTGKIVTGSFYILNAADDDCLLPRSDELLNAVKRIESKEDYLLPLAKAETKKEAMASAVTLLGDILLALCWGYWQGLFEIEAKSGEHPKTMIQNAEKFLVEHKRWYTVESHTRRRRLEDLRGWKSEGRFWGAL